MSSGGTNGGPKKSSGTGQKKPNKKKSSAGDSTNKSEPARNDGYEHDGRPPPKKQKLNEWGRALPRG
jgi:hypothetical protein